MPSPVLAPHTRAREVDPEHDLKGGHRCLSPVDRFEPSHNLIAHRFKREPQVPDAAYAIMRRAMRRRRDPGARREAHQGPQTGAGPGSKADRPAP
jgi:hypothetical protein